MMTARRERTPSGLTNFQSPIKVETSRNLAFGHDNSKFPDVSLASSRSPQNDSRRLESGRFVDSGRPSSSHVNSGRRDMTPESIMQRIRDKARQERLTRELAG